MKKNIFLFFVFISIFTISSCCANWTPPEFWNVKISPTTVKRGEEITITYDIRSTEKEYIESLFVDEYGTLLMSEDFMKNHENYDFQDNYNDFVRFNTKLSDGAKEFKTNIAEDCTSMDYECGKEKITISYVSEDYKLSNVYPAKYISFEVGKIVCKVPDNAISSVISLYGANAIPGFSDEKLIIVDENGNEITE